jgi:hypothetical protein
VSKNGNPSETRSRVAEQQPWALLDICEEQNLEMPRYGTREKGDPLANVVPRAATSPLRISRHAREPRDPVSAAHECKRSHHIGLTREPQKNPDALVLPASIHPVARGLSSFCRRSRLSVMDPNGVMQRISVPSLFPETRGGYENPSSV